MRLEQEREEAERVRLEQERMQQESEAEAESLRQEAEKQEAEKKEVEEQVETPQPKQQPGLQKIEVAPRAEPINYVNHLGPVEFQFDNLRQRIILVIDSSVKEVELPPELQYICGFEKPILTKTTVATYHVNYSNNLDSLYVYLNILEPVAVGNVRTTLLRIVPRTGNFGQVVSKIFNPINYLPVRQLNVNSLHVEITDEQGHHIKFAYGTVICVLRFKRVV